MEAPFVRFIDTVGFGHATGKNNTEGITEETRKIITSADAVIILNAQSLIVSEGAKNIIRSVVGTRGHSSGIWLFATQMDKKYDEFFASHLTGTPEDDESGEEDLPLDIGFVRMGEEIKSHLKKTIESIQREDQWADGSCCMFNALHRDTPVVCTGFLQAYQYPVISGKRRREAVKTPEWMTNSIRNSMKVITAPIKIGEIADEIRPVYRLSDFYERIKNAIQAFRALWVGADGNWLSRRHHWCSKRSLILNSARKVFFHSGATRLAPIDDFCECISMQAGFLIANPISWTGVASDLSASGRKTLATKEVGSFLTAALQGSCVEVLYNPAMMANWETAIQTNVHTYGSGCSAERNRIMDGAFTVALEQCVNLLMESIGNALEEKAHIIDDGDKIAKLKSTP